MLLEQELEHWIAHIRERVALPLRLALWNGKVFDFSTGSPLVTLRVPHATSLPYLLSPSLSNLGEAYVEGKIDIDGTPSDIIAIGHKLATNTLRAEGALARITRYFKHNKKDDAEAISYHYDVSDDFYKLWLDENMVYSCAYFENGDESLDEAQIKKIDHILTKIQLRPGHTLLDIGCGWGALVLRAASQFGAKCVGVTLSKNQYAFATEQVARAGLADRIEIRLQDYRDLTGKFDRITSVGMFEHVGLNNLGQYFTKIHSLLMDDGIALNHGITSSDPNNGETAFGGGAFIEKYVFPHGQVPHLNLVVRAMQEGGLEVLDVESLRRHYAKTCALWAERFERFAPEIEKIAGPRRFRIWRVYLAGCAYAFDHDSISIYQVLCTKSGREGACLPWSRRYMYATH